MKKSGELWSTKGLELHVTLYPLKCTFLRYYISVLSGCCVQKLLHALEIDQGYLELTPAGTWFPPPKKKKNLKFQIPLLAKLFNTNNIETLSRTFLSGTTMY